MNIIEKIKAIEDKIASAQKELQEIKDTPISEAFTPKVEFKVGKWYFVTHPYPDHDYLESGALINYQGYEKDHYGWDFTGRWLNDFGNAHKGKYPSVSPATESEVKDALVREAERRGFKEGATISRPEGFKNRTGGQAVLGHKTILKSNFDYTDSADCLEIDEYAIYSKGKWAEIVKDETIKIGGYEVLFNQDRGFLKGYTSAIYTTIDGNTFAKEFWQSAKVISEHSKACVKVGCSKQFDVSLETINAILAKL